MINCQKSTSPSFKSKQSWIWNMVLVVLMFAQDMDTCLNLLKTGLILVYNIWPQTRFQICFFTMSTYICYTELTSWWYLIYDKVSFVEHVLKIKNKHSFKILFYVLYVIRNFLTVLCMSNTSKLIAPSKNTHSKWKILWKILIIC